MHDIKEIRANFDEFKNKIKNRNIKINLDNILDLDKKYRTTIQEKEHLFIVYGSLFPPFFNWAKAYV